MPVELNETGGGKVLEIRLSGKLTSADYENFVPSVEGLIKEHGKLRLLVVLHDFHGWTMGAMWEDMKFDYRHFHDIERLAIVGEKKWEAGMAAFCKPFTSAKIQYFDQSKAADAQAWISAS